MHRINGSNLRVLRQNAGLSQDELANRSGIPQGNISRLERQPSANIRGRTMGRLCKALSITPGVLDD
jgi:transcriptional regulator with XRE-family HTH domain